MSSTDPFEMPVPSLAERIAAVEIFAAAERAGYAREVEAAGFLDELSRQWGDRRPGGGS